MPNTDEQIPEDFLAARKKAKRSKHIKIAVIASAIVIIIAGASIAFALYDNNDQEKSTTQSYTQTVEKGTLSLTIEGSGTLAAKSTTSENASVSGDVKKVYVTQGDTVSKGDTLFTMESDTLSDALSSAQKNKSSAYNSYIKAKTALLKAKKALKKAKTTSALKASNNEDSSIQTAQEAVSKAQENLTQAKSTYSDACTAYTEAAEAMDDLTVSASISGKVSSVNIEAGDSIDANSTDSAVEIINTDTMTLSVNVSEYDIGNIKRGQSATVNITALDKSVKASVKSVSLTASSSSDSSTAYYPVTLVIKKPTSKMLTGMNATATITYKKYKDYLLVPTSAISSKGDTSTVTVQGQDGTTSQVEVKVIASSDDTSAVESDSLSEGDTIVVSYQVNTDDGADQSSNSGAGGFGAITGQQGSGSGAGGFGEGGNMSGGGQSSSGGSNMPSPPSGNDGGNSSGNGNNGK